MEIIQTKNINDSAPLRSIVAALLSAAEPARAHRCISSACASEPHNAIPPRLGIPPGGIHPAQYPTPARYPTPDLLFGRRKTSFGEHKLFEKMGVFNVQR